MKIFEQCCQAVAEKHGRSSFIAEIYDRARPESKYTVMELVEEAATLYANEKLKGLWEEVNLFAQVFEQKSESAEDEGQDCHLSGRAAVYREIATRIEELIEELSKTTGHVRP